MLTTSAGPDVSLNWREGETRIVEDADGQALIDAGLAVSLETVVPKATEAPAVEATVLKGKKTKAAATEAPAVEAPADEPAV